MSTIGRPRVAVSYVWITFLVAAVVFVKGFFLARSTPDEARTTSRFTGYLARPPDTSRSSSCSWPS